MKLTPEQRRAVRSETHTLLEACPGSGKTRAIIAKLIRATEEVRNTSRRIACITYTNAAVEEIEERLRRYGAMGDEALCEVSTIHTFCLTNILRRFHWRIPCYRDRCTIVPPESSCYEEVALAILDEHGISRDAKDDLPEMNRQPDGTPITSNRLTPAAARDFWTRLEATACIDFPNIVYRSYELLRADPSIARGIAARFAWMLIDEFQDTSALQLEILKLIAAPRLTKFFLVGDPHQSIYRFAGADPSLMGGFAAHLAADTDYHLTESFRCSAPIITDAELLIPRVPAMHPAPDAAPYTETPRYVPVDDPFDAITDEFLPAIEACGIPYGRAAILAPTWFGLYPLGRKLREYGIPVYGPGARPYGRSHAFGLLAEPVCAYLTEPSPKRIALVEKELFLMLAQVTNRPWFNLFTYEGRLTVTRLLQAGEELRRKHDSGVEWLMAAAERFSDILIQDEFLPEQQCSLLSESTRDMIHDMEHRHVDTANLTVDDLGLFANPDETLKLLTIHRS